MSLLIIRAHKRFAVCRKARLRRPGRRGTDALLIELSREGCRLSNVAPDPALATGAAVILRLDGGAPIEARVRWQREGTVGLRFERALHNAELERLIRLCRGESYVPGQRAYAT